MGNSKITGMIGLTIFALLNFIAVSKAQSPEKRLEEMKLSVPKPVPANNSYVGAV